MLEVRVLKSVHFLIKVLGLCEIICSVRVILLGRRPHHGLDKVRLDHSVQLVYYIQLNDNVVDGRLSSLGVLPSNEVTPLLIA